MLKLIPVFLPCILYCEFTITGVIMNESNDAPIAGVNIFDKSSRLSDVSNKKGQFSLKVKDFQPTEITFSHIGFDNYSAIFNEDQSGIIIKLKETSLLMNDIVVTSTKNGYLLRDVPITTEVISRKEIEASGAITLSDIILQRSGISASYNLDGSPTFKMLGLDQKHILVLENGTPITGKFNNVVDVGQISINRIQKIEIIKGPCSALYGSDAMGAVINIVSDKSTEETSFNTSYRTSSSDASFSNLLNLKSNGIIRSNIAIPINKMTINNDVTIQNFSNNSNYEYLDADNINKLNFNTEVILKLNKHTLEFSNQFFKQNNNEDVKLFNGTIINTNETLISRNQFLISHLFRSSETLSISQSLRTATYSRNYVVKDMLDQENSNDLTEEDNIEYKFWISKNYSKTTINGGAEFSKPHYISDRLQKGEQNRNISAFFGQITNKFSNNIDVVLGLRHDNFDTREIFSPRIAFAFKRNENTTYRFSYGHGFRTPSFSERLIDWENAQVGYTIKGNPSLKPEISKGVNVGLEFSNMNNFQINSLFYFNSFSNLIKSFSTEPGVFTYENIEIAYYRGLEIITKWVISNSLSSSFTINFVENEDGDGNQLPETIPLSFGGKLSYTPNNEKTILTTNLRGIGPYKPMEFNSSTGSYAETSKPIKAYLLGDVLLNFNINKKYNIIFGITNITNHTNSRFGPYLGRSGYIEIKAKLDRK